MSKFEIEKVDFAKYADGLVPTIIQDFHTRQVLMLGYSSNASLQKTVNENKVTFFSRSKNRLWTKGESSKNFLIVKDIYIDCDQDALLILVKPEGPTCHQGSNSCFKTSESDHFLHKLEAIISNRIADKDPSSYTYQLFDKGLKKVAQKVGEEAVELILEAQDDQLDLFKNEAADLLYHLTLLLRHKNVTLAEIEELLYKRHKK
ncbi:MAG: bifunctional phosphoribosyl-AMP cyclohydrolase/phosphoribosyl-ATP diphosphatase HisIE [Flavobacteriales bacterium]|nr:bifunctional phosphoribosyl-AMP cyclohydrolase/phosphoribosyl-ATP diphosphatase HisIE [Flavobacteriales bacterium]